MDCLHQLEGTSNEFLYVLSATLDKLFQVVLSKLYCSRFIEQGSIFCAQDFDCRLDMSYQKFACVPCGWLNWCQHEAYGTLDPMLNPGSRRLDCVLSSHCRLGFIVSYGQWSTALLADSIATKNPKTVAIHLSPAECSTW